MDSATKSSVDRRLARLEGQVRGLRKMVNDDVYCVDILTQVAAARSALDQVGAELATGHVKNCIIGHGTPSEHDHCKAMSQDELIEELRTTLSRLMK
jgi:DNA-binding FrmR family transcriptional regulator